MHHPAPDTALRHKTRPSWLRAAAVALAIAPAAARAEDPAPAAAAQPAQAAAPQALETHVGLIYRPQSAPS